MPKPIFMAKYLQRRRYQSLKLWLLGLGVLLGVAAGGGAVLSWSTTSAQDSGSTPGSISFHSCGMIRRNCVVDGDTFWIKGEKVRIVGIDAPETSGSDRCKYLRSGKNPSWCDFELGSKARTALGTLLSRGPVKIHRQGQDKYGRTLATVSVNGRDVGGALFEQGFARRWRN